MPGQADRGVTRRSVLASVGGLGATVLGGCVENPHATAASNGGPDGEEIVVTGSSTVFPVSNEIAESFIDEYGVNVTVDPTGTGGGFSNSFCPGTSSINGASRPIADVELETCADNDVEPIEFEVAGDALTVVVNNDADWMADACLTFEELSRIWREGGAQRWSDVRDDWPDAEIELYGPPPTSGTYDWFSEHVVGEDHQHTTEHEQTEDDPNLLRGVESSEYAMGYFGFAYYAENEHRVTAVTVSEDGEQCAEPTLENAADGSYPMARPLYIYVNRADLERDVVFDFVAYYIEQCATETVADVGYVPITEETRDENLATLLLERP